MAEFITNAAAIVGLDAITDLVDVGGAGALKIYSGSVPANADTALSGQTLLAELAMSATAFQGAVDDNPGAIATANSISDDSSANATGTAAFFRIESGGGTVVFQGAVGLSGSGAELILDSTSITAGQTVQVTSLTVKLPEGA